MLVHGWSNDANGVCWYGGFTNSGKCIKSDLQEYLEEDSGYDVFNLQYYPANLSARKNAWIFGNESNRILNTYYPSQPKMNVVSHSMGSLAVRGYIQDMATDVNGNILSYSG